MAPRPEIEYLGVSSCGPSNFGSSIGPGDMQLTGSAFYTDSISQSEFYMGPMKIGTSWAYAGPHGAFNLIGTGTATPFTLSANIYHPPGFLSWFAFFVVQGDPALGSGWASRNKLNVLTIRDPLTVISQRSTSTGSWATHLFAPVDSSTSSWFHVAIAWDGNRLDGYVNGVFSATIFTGALTFDTNNLAA